MAIKMAQIPMTHTELNTMQEALFAVQRMPDFAKRFTTLQQTEIQWVLDRIGAAFVELGNQMASEGGETQD